MIIIFGLFIIFSFWQSKLFTKSFNTKYISKNGTLPIKGIFVIIVFFSHIVTYMSLTKNVDIMVQTTCQKIGQLMVTMFLFYSGYGVYESIKYKDKYIDNLPKNRLLKLLFEFDIAIITFFILDLLLGYHFGKKDILLSLIGWSSIGNSNWYIFAIISLYLITYISFKVFKKNRFIAIFSTLMLSILYIFILSKYKESYWVDTVLCYPFGMIYSLIKDKHENIMYNNNHFYLFTLLITIITFLIFYNHPINIYIRNITACIFSYLIMLITMKLKITNKYISWYGKNLFWFYILQRIPMMTFQKLDLNNYNIYLFLILSFIIATVLTYFYSKYIPDLESHIWKRSI